MEGFFKLNGINNIISSNDFSSDKSLGVTGIPDHLLYKKLIQKKINYLPYIRDDRLRTIC